MPSPEQPSPPEQFRQRIAQLNDEFRHSGPNEHWVATVGALALPDFPGLVQAVRDFDNFTPDNDSYGEHDFGAIDWHDEKTVWKLDYFDQQRVFAEDPLSPECCRILTMMLASEY